MYTFLNDTNFGLTAEARPLSSLATRHNIQVEESVDLKYIDARILSHEVDIACIPAASFHKLYQNEDDAYHGLVISTSKTTGLSSSPSVLLVKTDDTASGILDLEGASYGYINESCTSSFLAPSALLNRHSKTVRDFFNAHPVQAWQGQIDAVVSGEIRATMVPEDVWLAKSKNAQSTKVIERWDANRGCIVVAKSRVDANTRADLIRTLIGWFPPKDSLIGPFRPYSVADVFPLFEELDRLAEN